MISHVTFWKVLREFSLVSQVLGVVFNMFLLQVTEILQIQLCVFVVLMKLCVFSLQLLETTKNNVWIPFKGSQRWILFVLQELILHDVPLGHIYVWAASWGRVDSMDESN